MEISEDGLAAASNPCHTEGRQPNPNWVSQFSLEHHTAVVTGAAGGLGEQLTAILLDAGANVVLADLAEEKLGELAARTPGRALAQSCDVTSKRSVSHLIDAAHKRFGAIDVLVNCAGILGADALALDVGEADWDRVIDVNLKGTWMTSTEVARYMVERGIKGRIVNISSSLGPRAQLKRVPYAASKAGVEHLTRTMAMELVRSGVRVNCLAPGWMNTEMVKTMLTGSEGERWRGAIPMGRAAQPRELAGPLLLLASEASSYMTGSILRVDGGYAYCGIELPE